jgi:hypothetical protein
MVARQEIHAEMIHAGKTATLISEWPARGPSRLGASLAESVGYPAYGTQAASRRVYLMRCCML